VYIDLGRRIERIFYLGAVLIAICLAQVYLVTTVVYVKSQNPLGLRVVANKLSADLDRLQTLYDRQQAPRPTTDLSKRSRLVKQTRARLGLPPPAPAADDETQETYHEALSRIIKEASDQTGMDTSSLSKSIDASQSPAIVLDSVISEQKKLASKPVLVWGIETPIVLPVQYGKAEYQVPASVIAYSLLIALAPVLVIWLGSLYITRQRELMAIRTLEDYRQAFPHVLNILPVVFLSFPWIWDKRLIRPRQKRAEEEFNRIVSSILRTLILLMFIVPMIGMYCYSGFQLMLLQDNLGFLEFTFYLLTSIWLLIQAIMLVLQEWAILWGRTFSA